MHVGSISVGGSNTGSVVLFLISHILPLKHQLAIYFTHADCQLIIPYLSYVLTEEASLWRAYLLLMLTCEYVFSSPSPQLHAYYIKILLFTLAVAWLVGHVIYHLLPVINFVPNIPQNVAWLVRCIRWPTTTLGYTLVYTHPVESYLATKCNKFGIASTYSCQ